MREGSYMLASEAARRLGLSPQEVRRLVDTGRLEAERGTLGIRLISKRDVERLAEERAEHGRAGVSR
jgi:excisionase family DNA binding protein